MVTIKIYLLKCRLFFFFWLFGTILFFVTFCFSLSPGDIVMLSCFNPDHSLSLSDRGRILQKKRGQRGGSFLLYIITSTKTKQGRTKSWVTIAVIIAFFYPLPHKHPNCFLLIRDCSGAKFFHCQEGTFKEDI